MRKATTIALCCLLLLVSVSCSRPKHAHRILTEHGYTDIVIKGWSPWGCSEEDDFTTAFVATSVSGDRVSGYVCSGWFKVGTIRLK
jgi:hypothetical protein